VSNTIRNWLKKYMKLSNELGYQVVNDLLEMLQNQKEERRGKGRELGIYLQCYECGGSVSDINMPFKVIQP
jgi:hypothetical protein